MWTWQVHLTTRSCSNFNAGTFFSRSFQHSNCAVLCSRPLPLISRPNLLQVQHQEALERAREITFANKSWHHMFQDAGSFLQVFKPIMNLYIWWNLKAGKGKNWCLNMFDRYSKSITAIWTSCCARESWKISVKNLQGQSDRTHSKIINDWRTQRDVTS